MVLDPQMRRQITKLQKLGRPRYAGLSPRQARLALRGLHDRCRVTAPEADVRDIVIGSLRFPLSVRLYTPCGAFRPRSFSSFTGAGG